MSLFKEMLSKDLSTTFFNPNEFAETVSFNGKLINITFDEDRLERFNRKNDEEGLTRGELLFYADKAAFEKRPFRGQRLAFKGRPYEVMEIMDESGVLVIVLEGVSAL
ncbi:MAG: hypothetical protein F9K39_01870 [Exiguobacterium chiriqhucha]|uniref:hypothetical protein n=1 Tax=Exiguobacterium chiriqhucha TaxID=1385984 RepID=UPI00144E6FCB|nr:hypothetical protein [Exiguobacterium chiriqhucha]KAB2865408.1 MAG: hypothetical protein F9K39_01870 [Exiguobacterium chiriqhucha]